MLETLFEQLYNEHLRLDLIQPIPRSFFPVSCTRVNHGSVFRLAIENQLSAGTEVLTSAGKQIGMMDYWRAIIKSHTSVGVFGANNYAIVF